MFNQVQWVQVHILNSVVDYIKDQLWDPKKTTKYLPVSLLKPFLWR